MAKVETRAAGGARPRDPDARPAPRARRPQKASHLLLSFTLLLHFYSLLVFCSQKCSLRTAALPVRATATTRGVHRRGERVDPHVARPVRVRGLVVVQLAAANVPHDDVARGVAPQRHVEGRG